MLVLSAAEIADLTARVKAKAQARQLEHLGIPYRLRSDGSLVVLRIHATTVEPTHDETTQARTPRLRFGA